MLILKHNRLPCKDLFVIERHLVRWLDNKGPKITPDWHVLELSRTDLYGHLLGIFSHLKVFDTLDITPSQLLDFLVDVDTAYMHTPYHSFYHAADIVMMLHYILVELDGLKHLQPIHVPPLLISALCHDMGHPGYNNVYQVNSKTALAQRYNNQSVLENYSVDITQDLLLKHNLFDKLDFDWKDSIKQLILSTDMVYHYQLQEKAGALEEIMAATWSDDEDDHNDDHLVGGETDQGNNYSHDYIDISNNNNNNTYDDDNDNDSHASSDTESIGFSEPPTPTVDHILDQHFDAQQAATTSCTLSPSQCHDFCRIILHAADISNTVRPWSISKQWSDLIVQEFFRQGDAEKLAGLDVSPGMDRDESDQATISLKFGDFVVRSYFEALAGVLPKSRVFLTTLAENRLEWLQLKDSPVMALTPPPPPHERHFPSSLLPSAPVPNPPGRRVSVPAGLVIIPDRRWQKQRFLNRHRQHYLRRHHHRIIKPCLSSPLLTPPQQQYHPPLGNRFAMRSASHPEVLPDLIFHHSNSTTMIGASQLSRLIQSQQRKTSDNGSTDETVTAIPTMDQD
ncbi:hypothetical protein [Absidia glauca]|uniref:Phosphodiesterase n=1 Tax=Absidia glauca TaxID=4829 RepID=A0A168MCV5_ABSGL|nr:hypothetical protein [Absidia glauca]